MKQSYKSIILLIIVPSLILARELSVKELKDAFIFPDTVNSLSEDTLIETMKNSTKYVSSNTVTDYLVGIKPNSSPNSINLLIQFFLVEKVTYVGGNTNIYIIHTNKESIEQYKNLRKENDIIEYYYLLPSQLKNYNLSIKFGVEEETETIVIRFHPKHFDNIKNVENEVDEWSNYLNMELSKNIRNNDDNNDTYVKMVYTDNTSDLNITSTQKPIRDEIPFVFHDITLTDVLLTINYNHSFILSYLLQQPSITSISSLQTDTISIDTISPSPSDLPFDKPQIRERILNNKATHYIQSADGEPVIWNHNIHGENQYVAVGDSGLDVDHCFFKDSKHEVSYDSVNTEHRKVIEYEAFVDSKENEAGGHGTHVCGSIAGIPEDGDRLSYESKLYLIDLGSGGDKIYTPSNLINNYFRNSYTANVRVHSNSWGSPKNMYDDRCKQIDEFIYNNPDYVIVYAVGNYGEDGSGSVGTPATAKNIITVGSTYNAEERISLLDSDRSQYVIPYFSAQGPTYDGRIKPDVVTSGYKIKSSYSNPSKESCDTVERSGTSMSTPIIAAAASLVRQYFMEGYYPTGYKNNSFSFTPVASLIKAMIIHSGVNTDGYVSKTMTLHKFTSWPNYYQGFGTVQLDRSMFFSDTSDFILTIQTLQLESYENNTFIINAVENSHLKVTLVWTDPPAVTYSKITLVNNLDLLVIDCNNKYYYPNGNNAPDVTNNVEVVIVDVPKSKEKDNSDGRCKIQIIVNGTSIKASPQEYSLVYTGDFIDLNGNKNIPTKTPVSSNNSYQFTISFLLFIILLVSI